MTLFAHSVKTITWALLSHIEVYVVKVFTLLVTRLNNMSTSSKILTQCAILKESPGTDPGYNMRRVLQLSPASFASLLYPADQDLWLGSCYNA